MAKDPRSVFKNTCKKYFSSLSSRKCPYMYVNLPGLEDRLILTNSTPDGFVTRSFLSQIAIHVVRPIKYWLAQFKKIFLVQGSTVYLFKTPLCMALLKHLTSLEDPLPLSLNKKNDIVTTIDTSVSSDIEETESVINEEQSEDQIVDESDQAFSTVNQEEIITRDTVLKSSAVGVAMRDPHILTIIEALVLRMNDDLELCQSGTGVFELNLKSTILSGVTGRYFNNWYWSPYFTGADLCLDNGLAYAEQQMVLVDGCDLPSIVELLSKKPLTKDQFQFYIYTKDQGGSIKKLAHYKDETGDVLTTRPLDQVYLLSKRRLNDPITGQD